MSSPQTSEALMFSRLLLFLLVGVYLHCCVSIVVRLHCCVCIVVRLHCCVVLCVFTFVILDFFVSTLFCVSFVRVYFCAIVVWKLSG